MKNIYLAKKSKRIFARMLDMAIVFGLSILIFLTVVVPLSLDSKTIVENNNKAVAIYKDTGLFIVNEDGSYNGKASFGNIKKIEDLYNSSCTLKGKEYNNISLTKTLYVFYTTKFTNFGVQYNLTPEKYNEDVLKIGSTTSNIKSYNVDEGTFELIDNDQASVTIDYFLNIYTNTCKSVIQSDQVNKYIKNSQQIVIRTVLLIIPVIVAISVIFDLIIPLFTPAGQTIGKLIFKLSVISVEGYKLKKIKYIPRWFSIVVIEYILGVCTFGGTILISYTMFLFTKKRRCIHDFIAKSCVVDTETSIYFSDPNEERFYLERKKSLGDTI